MRRLAQRDLDTMIVKKISARQWHVVEKRDYPAILGKDEYFAGDGWYVIQTRP